ncbi:DUF6636 domain-containing protein [Celeribacter indicus]|nr:DUF6636 domain-containing protein [Celeribacter indicus]
MRVLPLCLLSFAAAPAHADVFTFETPSENVQCSVGLEAGASDILCTIIEIDGPSPYPRPANCVEDWGHDFGMTDRGVVTMYCQPLDRSRDGFDRAEYGVTGEFGGFTCTSSTSGLECRNEDGHGFFLSRSVQRVF